MRRARLAWSGAGSSCVRGGLRGSDDEESARDGEEGPGGIFPHGITALQRGFGSSPAMGLLLGTRFPPRWFFGAALLPLPAASPASARDLTVMSALAHSSIAHALRAERVSVFILSLKILIKAGWSQKRVAWGPLRAGAEGAGAPAPRPGCAGGVILAGPPCFHPVSATSMLPPSLSSGGRSTGMREVGKGHWRSRRGGNAGAKPELLCRHLPGSMVTHGGLCETPSAVGGRRLGDSGSGDGGGGGEGLQRHYGAAVGLVLCSHNGL